MPSPDLQALAAAVAARGALDGLGAPQRALERYALSLVGKRRGELERVVPLTLQVCPDLGLRYGRWLRRCPATPEDGVLGPGEREALRALPELTLELARDESLVAYAGDLLAFEVLRACSRRDGVAREHLSRFALSEIVADLERGMLPTEGLVRRERHRFHYPRPDAASRTAVPRRDRPHFLGAGIGYRARYHEQLLKLPPCVLEVMPDHFFACPERLDALAERHTLVFHDVGLSLGTLEHGDGVLRARLARVRELCDRARPVLFSEHLAFTRSRAIDLGHLCPIAYTRAALPRMVDALNFVQDALGMQLALENIAWPFVLPGEMSEPEFLSELGRQSGAQLLLDVSNLLANAHNFGFSAADRLQEYPLEQVALVHLAGGRACPSSDGFYVDTHDCAVASESYELLEQLLLRARPRAIIIERDERLPELSELLSEAARAQQLVTRRTQVEAAE